MSGPKLALPSCWLCRSSWIERRQSCCGGACRRCLPPGRRPLMAETGSGRRKRDRVGRSRIAVGLSPIAQLSRCAHLPMNDEQPEIVLLIASSLVEASAHSASASIGQSSPSFEIFRDPRIDSICRYFLMSWRMSGARMSFVRMWGGRWLHERGTRFPSVMSGKNQILLLRRRRTGVQFLPDIS